MSSKITYKQDEFIRLRAEGMSYKQISEQIGISKPTLIKWSKQFNNDIRNLKAIEHESLCQEFLACKQHRIRILGAHLNMIVQEIMNRDLSTIPTSKLFELEAKICKQLKDEDKELVFVEDRAAGPFEILKNSMVRKEEWSG